MSSVQCPGWIWCIPALAQECDQRVFYDTCLTPKDLHRQETEVYSIKLLNLWLAALKGYSFQQMERGNSSVRKNSSSSRADARSSCRRAASTLNDFCRQKHSSRQCCSCLYLCLLSLPHGSSLEVAFLIVSCSFDLEKRLNSLRSQIFNICLPKVKENTSRWHYLLCLGSFVL